MVVNEADHGPIILIANSLTEKGRLFSAAEMTNGVACDDFEGIADPRLNDEIVVAKKLGGGAVRLFMKPPGRHEAILDEYLDNLHELQS